MCAGGGGPGQNLLWGEAVFRNRLGVAGGVWSRPGVTGAGRRCCCVKSSFWNSADRGERNAMNVPHLKGI